MINNNDVDDIEAIKKEVEDILSKQHKQTFKKLLLNFLIILTCLILSLGFFNFLPYKSNKYILLFILVYTLSNTLLKYGINLLRYKYAYSKSILFRLILEFLLLIILNAFFDYYCSLGFESNLKLLAFFILNFFLTTFIGIYIISRLYFRKLRAK